MKKRIELGEFYIIDEDGRCDSPHRIDSHPVILADNWGKYAKAGRRFRMMVLDPAARCDEKRLLHDTWDCYVKESFEVMSQLAGWA